MIPCFTELSKDSEGKSIVACDCVDFTDSNFILKDGIIHMSAEGENIMKIKLSELLKPVEHKPLVIGGSGCTYCIDILLSHPFKDGRHRMCWILAGYFITEGYGVNDIFSYLKDWNNNVHGGHLSDNYILSQINSLKRTKRIPLCNARRNFFKSIGAEDLCPKKI